MLQYLGDEWLRRVQYTIYSAIAGCVKWGVITLPQSMPSYREMHIDDSTHNKITEMLTSK